MTEHLHILRDPRAACLGLVEVFYGPYVDLREEPEEERKEREQKCREICSKCEIIWPCLRWAMVEEEPWGVWGGMPFRQRQKFRRFLRKKYEGEIPDAQTVRSQHHFFLVEEKRKEKEKRKAAREQAARKKARRDGDRPVVAGNRGRGDQRKKGSPK